MFKPSAIKQFESRLEKIEDVTDSVRHFTFTVPQDFSFTAGQFCTILFTHNQRVYRRQYSVYSSPSRKGSIVLSIKYIENGPGSTYLWSLQENDTVKMMAPLGVFIIKEEFKQNPLVFIGTGTGLAPFCSMVADLLEHNYTHPLYVYSGHRHVTLYNDFFKNANINYTCVLSKGEHANKGYVQDYLQVIPDAHYYICGLYAMIQEVAQKLKLLGVPSTHIHFERYD